MHSQYKCAVFGIKYVDSDVPIPFVKVIDFGAISSWKLSEIS